MRLQQICFAEATAQLLANQPQNLASPRFSVVVLKLLCCSKVAAL